MVLWLRELGVPPAFEPMVLALMACLALLMGVNIWWVTCALAQDYPRVLALSLNDETAVFEMAGGARLTVPTRAIREVHSAPARNFHGRCASVSDETQVLLSQPVDGRDRLWISNTIRGYAAAVLRLQRLSGNPPSPSSATVHRISFADYWFFRWLMLPALAFAVPSALRNLLERAYGPDVFGAAVLLPFICLVSGISWFGLPCRLSVNPEGLHIRYALRTRRVPWGDLTGLEEPRPGVCEVKAGRWSLSLAAWGLSPFPDLIAVIAHYTGLPIPDPGEEKPEGV